MQRTTIALESKTRDDLWALKTGRQTYDDVLRDLMEQYQEESLEE